MVIIDIKKGAHQQIEDARLMGYQSARFCNTIVPAPNR